MRRFGARGKPPRVRDDDGPARPPDPPLRHRRHWQRELALASLIVVAERSDVREIGHLRGRVAAINHPNSHSGMNALRALIAPFSRDGRFFSAVKVSGAHSASPRHGRERRGRRRGDRLRHHALLARHRPAALDGTRVPAAAPARPTSPARMPMTIWCCVCARRSRRARRSGAARRAPTAAARRHRAWRRRRTFASPPSPGSPPATAMPHCAERPLAHCRVVERRNMR
jgi:hypothetical protein